MFDLVNFLIDRIYFMSQNHIRSTEQAKDAITVKGDLRLCATRSEGGRAHTGIKVSETGFEKLLNLLL